MRTVLLIVWLALLFSVVFIERKNPTEALLWVILLVLAPPVGAVLYLVLGSTLTDKVTRLILRERMKNRQDAMQRIVGAEDALRTQLSEEDGVVARFNERYGDAPLTSYRDAMLFTDGESHYRQLYEDIAHAEHSIHVLFYTIQNDQTGRKLVHALAEKAKQGVEVWVMFDFLANLTVPNRMYRELLRSGGQFKRVKPFIHHFRSHRKIVVIDGKLGYIGGMNIGDKYAGKAAKKSPWRDTQIRLTGACVRRLEAEFLGAWVTALSRSDCERLAPAFEEDMRRAETERDGSVCQIVTGGVETDKQAIKFCYLSLIRSAKQRIRIQTPYFIPDASVLDALKVACASGVEVELMVPGVSSGFFLEPVTRRYCAELMRLGARVLRYRGYIHAKTLTVDDEITCIGSANCDVRSLCIDDEICGIFYDDALVARHAALLDVDASRCDAYTLAQYDRRTTWQRMLERFYLLFAPLM